MALPPLLKRRAPDIADTHPADINVLQSRTRARRRLIGAAVLLVAGIIAFPLLFETQPRPVPVDIPMTIPSRDGVSAPLQPPPRSARIDSGTIADAPGEPTAASMERVPQRPPMPSPNQAKEGVPSEVAPARDATSSAAPSREIDSGKPAPKAVEKPLERPAVKPVEKPVERAADKPAARPQTPEPAKPAVKPAAAERPAKAARYVVQVGAYADEASAKEARQRVERLGLKTFVQEVEVQGVKRIRVRVGPFESQQDAARAVATLKAGKLPGVVLTL